MKIGDRVRLGASDHEDPWWDGKFGSISEIRNTHKAIQVDLDTPYNHTTRVMMKEEHVLPMVTCPSCEKDVPKDEMADYICEECRYG